MTNGKYDAVDLEKQTVSSPTSTALLCCPFCGGNHVSVDTAEPNTERFGYGVTCLKDGCMGNIYKHDYSYMSEELAINAWNQRAS